MDPMGEHAVTDDVTDEDLEDFLGGLSDADVDELCSLADEIEGGDE